MMSMCYDNYGTVVTELCCVVGTIQHQLGRDRVYSVPEHQLVPQGSQCLQEHPDTQRK